MSDIQFRESTRAYTYEEIATILGISPSLVRVIERRALLKLLQSRGKELKDLLEGYNELAHR